MLGICIGGSSIFDLWQRRIPNKWLAVWIFAGGLWVAESGFSFLLSMVTLVIIFSPLYFLRMIGAGDIKLMAVICGYLGLSDGFLLITYSFFIGAIFSTIKMLHKGIFLERIFYFIAYFRHYFHTGQRIEYYSADRDGYMAAIHFGVCLWLGFVIYLFIL